MAGISNDIEIFIKKLLDDNEGVIELKRNELANEFNCSPSQINYVLETRFQPTMGYYIESRRGGGGYIKIERIDFSFNNDFSNIIVNEIGDSITTSISEQIIDTLFLGDMITKREKNMINAAMEERVLDVKGKERNELRASLLKNMLLALFKE